MIEAVCRHRQYDAAGVNVSICGFALAAMPVNRG